MGILSRLLLGLLGLALAQSALAQGNPERIVAIGDLHGDYEAYLEIVEEAGLADSRGRWRGGETVLVQLGDLTDRGPDSRRIIEHLRELQEAAEDDGGQVIVLVGNHEAMNITGDLRYVHPGEYEAFANRNSRELRDRVFEGSRDALVQYYRQWDAELSVNDARERWFEENPLGKMEHRQAWSPQGEVGEWIVTLPAIARIGGSLFVHGGISVETAARSIEAVNEEVSVELAKGETYTPSILTDEFGPLWYRGNVMRDPPPEPVEGEVVPPPPERPGIEVELTAVLAAYDAERLVVAHTPRLQGIEASLGGRLIRVDTGISAHYGGAWSYLEIRDGNAVAHNRNENGDWVSEVLPSPGGGS